MILRSGLAAKEPLDGFCTGVTDQRENARTFAEFVHFALNYSERVDRIFTNGFETP